MEKDKEYILCAAIWYASDQELVHSPWPMPDGITLSGWRHCQIIEAYHALTGKPTQFPHAIQGFLTNKNQFVTRQEAAKIALSAGQINKPIHELTSEDLY